MDRSFSVLEVLETSWEIIKKNFLVIIGYSLVALIAFGLIGVLNFLLDNEYLIFVITLFTQSFLTLGFYQMIFYLIDKDDEIEIKSVIPTIKNVLSFIVLTLILGVIVATLSIIYQQLLTIPSFEEFVSIVENNEVIFKSLSILVFFLISLAAMRFMFFPCFIIDDNSSSFESLKQSRELTQNNLLRIITVLAVIFASIALGFLVIGVWIIVAYPFTNIILIVTYRQLVNTYTSEDNDELISDNL